MGLNVKKEFPKRLRQARADAKLNQNELAEKACITSSWISHFEAGRRLPSLIIYVKLCKALNVNAGFLIGLS